MLRIDLLANYYHVGRNTIVLLLCVCELLILAAGLILIYQGKNKIMLSVIATVHIIMVLFMGTKLFQITANSIELRQALSMSLCVACLFIMGCRLDTKLRGKGEDY